MPLPDKVQKLGNGLVETKSLVIGDKFNFGNKTWKVLAVKPDGIECAEDPTFFQYASVGAVPKPVVPKPLPDVKPQGIDPAGHRKRK
jgi:hypothetical protein